MMLTRNLFILLTLTLLTGPAVPSLQAADPLPLRVRMVLIKAAPLQAKGDFQAAADILAEFQGRFTGDAKEVYNHPAVNFALGNCFLLQAKHDAALTAYKRVIAYDPLHMAAWQNMAICQYETGAYENAAHSYQKAYALSKPPKGELLYYAAATTLMAHKPHQTVRLFATLLVRHPQKIKPAWRETYVHALLGVGKNREALPHIEILTRHYTGDKQAQWQEILLYQYLDQNKANKALTLATRLSRESPGNRLWWKALTHIHLLGARHDQALAALTIYSLLTSLTPEEQKLLADLHLQANIPVKAAPLYEQFLADKKDAAIIKRLARAYLQQHKPDHALKSLDKYGNGLKDPALNVLRGDLLYEMERYKEAATAYEETARHHKNMGRAWLMAGYSYWQLKNYTAARQTFTKAAGYKQLKKEASRALAQLLKNQQNAGR